VDVQVVPVAIDNDGGMEVPNAELAGWYELGPAPGAPGPAVIVAHVSSSGVRGAFYYLKKLEPGDEVFVSDETGDTAVFEVDAKEVILKSELPTERIWNKTQNAVIRLITCGGRFDLRTRHYESNVIVYAHLVS
jgi:sortase (surface protein transpeptidase)